jgi:hypothetical protein
MLVRDNFFWIAVTDILCCRSFCLPTPPDIFVQVSLVLYFVRSCIAPYSFRMALTAALVKGADVVCGAIVLRLLFNTLASISIPRSVFRGALSPRGLIFHDV